MADHNINFDDLFTPETYAKFDPTPEKAQRRLDQGTFLLKVLANSNVTSEIRVEKQQLELEELLKRISKLEHQISAVQNMVDDPTLADEKVDHEKELADLQQDLADLQERVSDDYVSSNQNEKIMDTRLRDIKIKALRDGLRGYAQFLATNNHFGDNRSYTFEGEEFVAP
ncbi:ABC transporter C-terminal domain-containing protein [Limibacter armeniacum]|uniref:ABC transporter C-terminal domain-containing protein n=1 Tax=Limibacter armeniacum TaxID=466084 RepID=UPI002FE61927